MSKLKPTAGEWSIAHMAKDGVECNCPWVLSEGYCGSIATINWSKDRELENGDNPPLDEAKCNAILIADAGTTFNKCGKLSSELLAENEELKDVLSEILKWHSNVVNGLGVELKNTLSFTNAKSLLTKYNNQ